MGQMELFLICSHYECVMGREGSIPSDGKWEYDYFTVFEYKVVQIWPGLICM